MKYCAKQFPGNCGIPMLIEKDIPLSQINIYIEVTGFTQNMQNIYNLYSDDQLKGIN